MKGYEKKQTKEGNTTKAFQEFCKFYDWFIKFGGEIPQEKYDVLIKKFEYEDNL